MLHIPYDWTFLDARLSFAQIYCLCLILITHDDLVSDTVLVRVPFYVIP